jgi:putative endopeptidase
LAIVGTRANSAPVPLRPFLLALAIGLAPITTAAAQSRSGIDLTAIDPGVRPQDDFWRFANGKWLAATEIPADKAGWDTFTALRETTQAQLRELIEGIDANTADAERRKLADFYASFMDEKSVEAASLSSLEVELRRIREVASVSDLPGLFAHLAPLWVRTPFFIDVGPDEHDATVYAAHLAQGRLGLPDRDYYLKDDAHFRDIRAAYGAHIIKLLSLAGEPASEAAARDIIALETSLARLQWTRVQNRDPLKTYNRRQIADLPALTQGNGWPAYFAAAGVEPGIKEVLVYQPSYLEGLGALLRDVSLKTWQEWLTYGLLSSYAPFMGEAFVAEDFAFEQKALRGIPENQPRWKRAVAIVDRSLALALGKLYVERYFPPASKARAEAMIGQLMAVYRQSIETLDWMGPETRRQALDKLAAIRPRIGYPDKWRDYGALSIERGDLVGNVMRARRFDSDFWMAKLGHKVDRDEWFTGPQVVNAFYNPNKNEISFPAGILQPPFFDARSEDAANYGGIGTVIGHEISHAFDDEGSRYDPEGNLRNWWTAEDRARFEAKTKALVEQYDAFSPLPGYHVNGALTLGENVADNSGLSMAVKAYRHSLDGSPAPVIDGYGGEQRLFLAFAQIWHEKLRDAARIERLKVDPHSPEQFRANGALRNQSAFDDAFSVKPGDGMYLPPDRRISLW